MRKSLLLFVKIFFSVGLLYVALRGIDFTQVKSRLSQINIGWIAVSFAVAALQLWLGAVRWRDVTAACGTELPLARAFRYNFIGAFFNQTLPSAIGGDAMRLWLLGRGGAGWRTATYSVFVDRAIGLIALAVLVVGTLPLSWQLIHDEKGRYALAIIGFGAIAAGASFLVLGRLPWAWLDSWFANRHLRACSTAANEVIFGRRTAPRIVVVSISIHVLAVVMIWLSASSIAAAAQPAQLFAVVPPVMLITMLPISIAGWGLREASMMLA